MSKVPSSSSDIAGPAILKLLGLPPETEKLTMTFAGGQDIKVECVLFVRDGDAAGKLQTILGEYSITQTASEIVAA